MLGPQLSKLIADARIAAEALVVTCSPATLRALKVQNEINYRAARTDDQRAVLRRQGIALEFALSLAA